MFEAVKNILGDLEVDSSGFLLVSGTATTSPSPLVTHLMTTSLASNQKVCLVLLHNTFGHYCNIGSKLGFNLKQHQEQGSLKVIEGLKLFCEIFTTDASDIDSHPFSFIQRTYENQLCSIYHLIKKNVLPWKEVGEKVQIIVENVTSFLSLGVKTEEIVLFGHYCRNLVKNSSSTTSGSLVMVTTADKDDDAATQVTNSLMHLASAHISLRGLQTGSAREVHGDLRLKWFESRTPTQCLPTALHMQYKMEERNMKLFAPGMSANVL
ncbi:elongator complex protein 6-like [Portunus trituberculatus]|uniref:elongator complex protein 6-like n=1 Tax=Portunus trituberculatus TaxID=210409 RepID=UPI001E1CB1FE|nr:elongator complex protein 6-like [Portunus trituberculatus]